MSSSAASFRRGPIRSRPSSPSRSSAPRPPASCRSPNTTRRSARSATGTTSCSSPTRSSAAMAAPAIPSPSRPGACCPTSSPRARPSPAAMRRLSATLAADKVVDAFARSASGEFTHGSTHSGNALSCFVGLQVHDYMKRHNLFDRPAQIGAYLHERLSGLAEKHDIIGDIQGPRPARRGGVRRRPQDAAALARGSQADGADRRRRPQARRHDHSGNEGFQLRQGGRSHPDHAALCHLPDGSG